MSHVKRAIQFLMYIVFVVEVVCFVGIGLSLGNGPRQYCRFDLGELIELFAFLGILTIQWGMLRALNAPQKAISAKRKKSRLRLAIILGIWGFAMIVLQQTIDAARCTTCMSSSLSVLYFVFLFQTISSMIYILFFPSGGHGRERRRERFQFARTFARRFAKAALPILFVLVTLIGIDIYLSPGGIDVFVTNKSGETVDAMTIYYRRGQEQITNIKQNETRTLFLEFSSETGIGIKLWNIKKELDIYIVQQYTKKLEIVINPNRSIEWIQTDRDGIFNSKMEPHKETVEFKGEPVE